MKQTQRVVATSSGGCDLSWWLGGGKYPPMKQTQRVLVTSADGWVVVTLKGGG
jgi:hypothetical protein